MLALTVGFAILAAASWIVTPGKPSPIQAAAQTKAPGGGVGSAFSAEFLDAFVTAFRGSCMKAAQATLSQHGADTSANGLVAKIEAYCTCTTKQTMLQLTIPELLAFKTNPSSGPTAAKVNAITQNCAAAMGMMGQ